MLTVVLTVVAVVLLVFVLTILLVSLAASKKLASPPRRIGEWIPSDLGLLYENFEYKTSDGVVLRGWLVRGSSEKIVVLLHGYTSSKWDEGYIKPALEVLTKANYSVLALDLRAHGESGGDYTTLGLKESDDIVEVVNELRRRGFSRIALYGYSMGASTSLMASTKVQVNAVVLDSPYVDIRTSSKRWARRVKGPLGPVLRVSTPLIDKLVSRRIRVNPEDLVMTKYASRVKAPVFLIAPEKDDLISLSEYKALHAELLKSGNPIDAWYVNTGHVEAWQCCREEYAEKLLTFLDKHL
ncbi:MAG: alpha/beta fold hydrolase [Desulfurococcaceae archaeon]